MASYGNLDEENWGKITRIVEEANLKQQQKIRWEQASRKKVYREELDMQVGKMHQQQVQDHLRKEKERKQINQQVIEEQKNKYLSKFNKIKTQQKYRYDNFHLAAQAKVKVKPLNGRFYQESPFIKLVDGQDERLRETKKKFQMQNKLNELQAQIHEDQKQRQRMQEKEDRNSFEKYVENDYSRREHERQKFKEKFLKIKKGETAGYEIPPQSTIKKAYVDFLDHQVVENKKKRKNEKDTVDARLSKINGHIQVPDASPAYLGRNPCSKDRQKQLRMLDRSLFRDQINQNSKKRIEHGQSKSVTLQSNEKKYERRQKLEEAALTLQLERRKKHNPNLPQITLNKKSHQQTQPSLITSERISPKGIESPYKELNQGAYSPPLDHYRSVGAASNPEERGRRMFKQYDMISGRQKTIFI